jgi:hypothetical protein
MHLSRGARCAFALYALATPLAQPASETPRGLIFFTDSSPVVLREAASAKRHSTAISRLDF